VKFAIALVVVVAALVGSGVASAAPVPTFTTACTDPAVVEPDLCERLDYIASELSAIDDNTASGGTSSVALSPDDQTRMDLTWWGVWAVAGLVLVLLIAPDFRSSWRFWR
jgi:hypothetical protein